MTLRKVFPRSVPWMCRICDLGGMSVPASTMAPKWTCKWNYKQVSLPKTLPKKLSQWNTCPWVVACLKESLVWKKTCLQQSLLPPCWTDLAYPWFRVGFASFPGSHFHLQKQEAGIVPFDRKMGYKNQNLLARFITLPCHWAFFGLLFKVRFVSPQLRCFTSRHLSYSSQAPFLVKKNKQMPPKSNSFDLP